MKKILALLLALVMLFALTACTGDDDTPTDGEDPTEAQGTEDDFDPEPAKYTRDEFFARLEGYTSNHEPDKKSHYDEGYDPEQENGFKEIFYVTDFVEEHELNLFLHETNHAEGEQLRGWLIIDQFRYEYISRTTYSVSLYYVIPCQTLEEAVALAKNDGYCLAPFYGLDTSDLNFYTRVDGKRETIQLTDEALGKLASGEYASIFGSPGSFLESGDSCRIDIDIRQTKDGAYEYSCTLRIQTTE